VINHRGHSYTLCAKRYRPTIPSINCAPSVSINTPPGSSINLPARAILNSLASPRKPALYPVPFTLYPVSMHITPANAAIASVFGAGAVLVWRIKEGRSAVTLKTIVIPPLGMATGFCMFIVPAFRIPWLWALGAFLIGAILLAWPLLATSRLHREGDTVIMKRSSMFIVVIIVLAAVRILARSYFDRLLTVEQTGALFFVLAFGMILRWRANMLLEYRTLTTQN
jgi:membrane protein CcdC involved in cytochrome C biogenesis